MIKEIGDYLDILKSKYPHISYQDLKRILEYGFYTFYMLNKKGADVQVSNRKYTAYCGRMFLNDNIRSLYNITKAKRKLRLLYKYSQEAYDGIYYFGLNDEEWEQYQSQIVSKKQNKVKFLNLKLYKIKEECFLDKSKTHFFMINYPIDIGWSFKKDELITKKFKHFADRDAKGKIVII